MVPRNAPKVTLEISHEKDKRITKNCEEFLRHLGDFGRHLGATRRQMAAQGGQSGAPNPSKIDAEIDAKINTEKVSKNMRKVVPK